MAADITRRGRSLKVKMWQIRRVGHQTGTSISINDADKSCFSLLEIWTSPHHLFSRQATISYINCWLNFEKFLLYSFQFEFKLFKINFCKSDTLLFYKKTTTMPKTKKYYFIAKI